MQREFIILVLIKVEKISIKVKKISSINYFKIIAMNKKNFFLSCHKKESILILLMLSLSFSLAAQQPSVIHGTVSDSTSIPLIGVTVQVKGTNVAMTTDKKGHYEIDAAKNATLVFSYVGYENKEVIVNGGDMVNVTLSATNTGLDEVVVIGYGTEKKVNLTGSIAAISGKQIKDLPA